MSGPSTGSGSGSTGSGSGSTGSGGVYLSRKDLHDDPVAWPVVSSTELAAGAITTYLRDEVRAPDGHVMKREYLRHPGAVAVIALDDENRVALVRQYRHPVRHRLVEPPAGLLDVQGEDYLLGAQRELAEEVGLAARDWRVLVDLFSSPGMASETMRIYLARDLLPADAPDGFLAEGEEADMDAVWAPLEDLVDAVLAGQVHNPNLVNGVLAAWVAHERGGFDALRPADARWPAREDEQRLSGSAT
jgi:8-oxo-dGTP pyrophosphatase MutT (NUDIX family)